MLRGLGCRVISGIYNCNMETGQRDFFVASAIQRLLKIPVRRPLWCVTDQLCIRS